MTESKVCPKCTGQMKVGNYTGNEVDWEKEQGQDFLRKDGFKIDSYACEKCGYIESSVKKWKKE